LEKKTVEKRSFRLHNYPLETDAWKPITVYAMDNSRWFVSPSLWEKPVLERKEITMSAFYNWDKVETMVNEQMKDMQRESEQVRLLRKAGLSNSSGRMAVAFGNALIKLGERLQKKHARSHQTYQATNEKGAM